MTWTNLEAAFAFGTKLTSAQQQQLRDNITAGLLQEPGAPVANILGSFITFGDGSDGTSTVAASDSLDAGVYQYDAFTLNTGINLGPGAGDSQTLVLLCSSSCTLSGIINWTIAGEARRPIGATGGGGGGGQGAGGPGVAGGSTTRALYGVASGGDAGAAGGGGGGVGGNGVAGANVSSLDDFAAQRRAFYQEPFMGISGGSDGGDGGADGNSNPGGAGGGGGGLIIIMSPLITVNSGALLDVSGGDGSTGTTAGGGGGGGGGGSVLLLANSGQITNQGSFNILGGSGASNVASGGSGGDGGNGWYFEIGVG